MPSTVEQLSKTRVKLTITVPQAELAPAIDKAYKSIAAGINIPGFRRGHVPNALIDQRFGRAAVLEQAINEQLPDLFNKAVAENELHPLGTPQVQVGDLDGSADIELSAEFDIRPEFDLPSLDGVTARVDSAVVSDEAVSERLDLLRQRFATFKELDRPAAKDDVVVLDITASQGGVDIADADTTGVNYIVGSGGLVDGLDEAVTGLSAGESKTFSSTLLGGLKAGEQADVTVTVNNVRQRELPPVNDEFAQMVSEYDTVEQMMAGLRDGLERIERVGQLNAARDQVLDAVIEDAPFDLPETVLEEEIAARREEIEEQLARAGLSVERYLAESEQQEASTPDEFWADIAARSERSLRARLVLDKVAEEEAVQVSQEDLSEFIVNKAMEDGVSPDEEARHMMDHNHVNEWLGEIRRGKAVDILVNRATIKDSDGRKIDLSLVRPDGTMADPQAAASSVPKAKPAAKKK